MIKKLVKSSQFTLCIAFIIILTAFSFGSKFFLTVSNLLNIGMYAAVVGVASMSITFVLACGLIDLSAGAIMGLSGMMGALVVARTNSMPLAVLATLTTGMLTGAINGLLVTRFKIVPFIATVGTAKLFRGLVYVASSGKSINIQNEPIKWFGRGYIGFVPVAFIIFLLSIIIFTFIAKQTVFGRKIFIIGGNSRASYLAGIKVQKIQFFVFMLNGLMCGLSGLLIISQLGACLLESGDGYEFNAISGAILGGVSMSGGKGSMVGTAIGVLVLSTLRNGLTMMNIASYWQNVVIGLVLIVAVALDIARTEAEKRALLKGKG